jgi:hypothetical protein
MLPKSHSPHQQVDVKVQENAWRARLSQRSAKRELLEGEIRAFVSALRSKASTPLSIRPSSAREKAVLDYVSGEHHHAEHADTTPLERLATRCASRGGDAARPQTAELLGKIAREKGEITYEKLEGVSDALQVRYHACIHGYVVAFHSLCVHLYLDVSQVQIHKLRMHKHSMQACCWISCMAMCHAQHDNV